MTDKTLKEVIGIIKDNPESVYDLFLKNLVAYQQIYFLVVNKKIENDKIKKIINYSVAIVGNLGNALVCRTLLANMLKEVNFDSKVILNNRQIIGILLSRTLADYLKPEWTPALERDWMDAFQKIMSFLEEEHLCQNLFAENNSNKICLDKIRVRAIASKAFREGCSQNLVVEMLEKDSYFQEIENKMGRERSTKIIANIVNNIKDKKAILASKAFGNRQLKALNQSLLHQQNWQAVE